MAAGQATECILTLIPATSGVALWSGTRPTFGDSKGPPLKLVGEGERGAHWAAQGRDDTPTALEREFVRGDGADELFREEDRNGTSHPCG